MGNILTCFQFTKYHSKLSAKDSNPASPANSNGTQHSQTPAAAQDVQRGLQDQHPPPPATVTATAAEDLSHATKEVGVSAPVPIASTTIIHTSAPVPHTSLSQAKEGNKEVKMASDEDYMSFLDKANRDPNEGTETAKSENNGKVELKATDKGVSVPQVLKKATEGAFYVSDADEPFVPVCLKLEKGKGLPDEATFAKLVSHPSPSEAEVSIMDIGEWDLQGQYKEIVDAVREASKGSDVRVYRISKEGARVEYWVVGVEGEKLVGVKALAVES